MIDLGALALAPELSEELCIHLKKLDLAEVEAVDKLFQFTEGASQSPRKLVSAIPPGFILAKNSEPLHVRVRGEFDLDASGLINDSELGTIGVLQLFPNEENLAGSTDEAMLEKWFRRRIDEAAYLRHLLVDLACGEGEEPHRIPFNVELVFILLSDNQAIRALIGATLRVLMRETALLHAIGVNFWLKPLGEMSHQTRAFPMASQSYARVAKREK
jgi:hypothetical protein